jgi:PAS domain S-box-containing protein
LKITWADTERGRGPTGTAIRTAKTVDCKNMLTDPAMAPWRENAVQRGYASSIALPLCDAGGGAWGALSIYATEPGAFDAEEVKLLEELAGDLAYGAQALHLRIERDRAQATAQAATLELDRFFNVALDLLCIADTEGYFLRLNPQWEKVLGYSNATMLAHRFIDFVHPDDVDRTLALVGDLSDQKQVWHFENRYRCKDGTYRWLEWNSFPAGTLIYAAVRDITERKEAEAALAQQQYLLTALMDNVPDRIYFKDTASRFIRFNRAFMKAGGITDPAQLTGKTDFDLFTEEHARPAYEDEQAIMRTGKPVVGQEEKETWTDGRVDWVLTTKMPLRDEAGQIIGTFGVTRDITER